MTEIEVYQPPAPVAVRAQDIDSWTAVAGQVIKLANEIHDTPFVPDGLRGSIPATAAAILAGRELGLGPMTSLANVHVIKGKPALSAALMRALILAQGHQIETLDVSDTRVVVRGRRRGEATWEEASFTADQAKRAGIQLGGYPQDKLYARATSRLARRKFADVIAGMPYSAEELEDGDEQHAEPAPAAVSNGQAAPRTARRRQAPAERPTAAPAAAATAPPQPASPAPATAQAADSGLPPLPGEDEEPPAQPPFDPDEHGTATRGKGGQLTALWTVLNEVYEFDGTETGKKQARVTVEQIIGRDLDGGTTGDLSYNEAAGVIDTLQRCKLAAEKEGVTPREQLIVLLTAGDKSDG